MNQEQELLRENVKMLKWKYGVSYKSIANDVLNMSYNAFLNFVNGYKELGYNRARLLKIYIRDYLS